MKKDIKLITYERARELIEDYFDLREYDKTKINSKTKNNFNILVYSDYEEWLQNLLDSEFKYSIAGEEIGELSI